MSPADPDADTPIEPLSAEELSELARLLNRYGRAQVIEHGKATNPCRYTHTRAWCGYPFCRES